MMGRINDKIPWIKVWETNIFLKKIAEQNLQRKSGAWAAFAAAKKYLLEFIKLFLNAWN
jgi:hypothetical protein